MSEEAIPAQEGGSCTRKHPPTRQAAAQKEHPLETRLLFKGLPRTGFTRPRRGCCRRRGRRLLHEEGRCTSGAPGAGYAQEAFLLPGLRSL